MSGVGPSLHISDVHFNFDFHYSSRIAVLSSGPSLSNFVRNLITKFARHRVGLIYRKQFRWNFISFQPCRPLPELLVLGLSCHRQRFLQLPSYGAIPQQWPAKLKKLENVENFKCIISDHFTFLGDDLASGWEQAKSSSKLQPSSWKDFVLLGHFL